MRIFIILTALAYTGILFFSCSQQLPPDYNISSISFNITYDIGQSKDSKAVDSAKVFITDNEGFNREVVLTIVGGYADGSFELEYGTYDFTVEMYDNSILTYLGEKSGQIVDKNTTLVDITMKNAPFLSVNPDSLDFSNVSINSYSSEKTFTLTGNNLTGDVILTPSVFYEISKTTATGFVTTSLSYSPTSGSVNATVYVRIKPTLEQTYIGEISCETTNIKGKYISLTCTGVPEEEFIAIPAGSFSMGSTFFDEQPVHTVNLTRPFYLGRYEVTQQEWLTRMGSNPSYFTGDLNRPVERVSWYAVLVYCNKRSVAESLTPCYTISGSTDPADWGSVPTSSNSTWDAVTCNFLADGYRLPTEAEREYAARYNDGRTYPWGETALSSTLCNYNSNVGATTAVGSYQPGNSNLGLCDMAGNVHEWVWDWYATYPSATETDPDGPDTAQSTRVVRGGAWDGVDDLRCASRYNFMPDFGNIVSGFRLARTITPPPEGFIDIPTGSFSMGQTDVATPVHIVNITRPYYLGKYEVTQKEWSDIIGSNPASGYGVGNNYPVYSVSWYSILVYCNKRSVAESLTPCYTIGGSTDPNTWGSVPTISNATWNAATCNYTAKGYRLPTEAEWEHAARYNDGRTYPWGETAPSSTLCNYNNNVGAATVVGSYPSGNSNLVLCDMAGNVWEWVWDWHATYPSTTETDPDGPDTAQVSRVLRGGSRFDDYTFIPCAYRDVSNPYNAYSHYGLRLAMTK